MGTEITQEDLDNIQLLAEQVVGFTEYRQQLSSYLSARMQAIAPNLTELVGELVGARLISHAGSLMNLAKSPASTIQILGAEKALFRALKTKHDTPKYGLIYHASLVGQATGKNKGKIARMLAAKAAIGLRVDALSDWSQEGEGKGDDVDEEERSALGVLSRAKIERHLRGLEGKPLLPRGVAVGPNGQAAVQPGKWELKEAKKYNADADGISADAAPAAEKPSKKEKTSKKEKKLVQEVESESSEDEDDDVEMKDAATPGKKEKKGKEQTDEEKYGALAAAAGISVSKYKRKAERGEIKLGEDGKPVVVSKKDLKKEKKKSEKKDKKRKRDSDDESEEEEKKEKKDKKKKKSKD
jgi:nucleolar protein 58